MVLRDKAENTLKSWFSIAGYSPTINSHTWVNSQSTVRLKIHFLD